MKKLSYLALAAVGLLLGACSSDKDVAENARRTPPGVDGDDFTPYFRALKEIGYRGNISIECGWSDFRKQVGPAIQELQRQLKAVGM